MASKTITIMEDVYKMLKQRKFKKESFSDYLRRAIGKPDIAEVAGSWSHIPEEEIAGMKEEIQVMRGRYIRGK